MPDAWLNLVPANARPYSGMEKASCELADMPGDRSYLNCLSADELIKDVFLDSDTSIMVLSFAPSTQEREPFTIEDANETRNIVAQLDGSKRLMIHGRVNPNQDGDLEAMDELAERWDICAFKTYPQFGPGGVGFWLHDDPGLAMIERARSLGVRNICIHKGLPFGPVSLEHSRCDDVGVVAKMYPDNAAHSLGKLFKYVGQDNVLWGTDSIWYGSPQDQIQAFLAGDNVSQRKLAYMNNPQPHFKTYGPKTRGEFLNFLKLGG